MASSKALFLLLCVVFALVLLISSEVSASIDQTRETIDTKGVGFEDAKYGNGYDPGYGGGRGGGGGGGGYYGRGRCGRYGCCRRYRNQPGCYRCCSHATEVPDVEFEDDHHVKH